MNTIGIEAPGEFIGSGMRSATSSEAPPAPLVVGVQPAAVAIPPLAPPDPEAMNMLCSRIEKLLREAKKPTCGETRLDEISDAVRSQIPGLLGEIVAGRRRRAGEILRDLYEPRFARLAMLPFSTQHFRIVVEGRRLSGEFQNCRDNRGQLFSKAQGILETYRSEVQNEAAKI